MLMTKKTNKTKQDKKIENVPNYAKLPISCLKTADYQRPVNWSNVTRYSKKIDWDIFGSIIVSYRDGEYWIVDGQHRVEAIRKSGITDTLMCIVWENLDYKEESAKFLKLNSERSGLTFNQKFHARVESGDIVANNISKLLHEYEFDYPHADAIYPDSVISAMSAIERSYQKSEKKLRRTLNIVKRAWYGENSSLTRNIIGGIFALLSEYTRINDDILIDILENVIPKNLEIQAQFIASKNNVLMVSGGGKSTKGYICIAKAIKELYNDNVPKSQKIA